MANLIDDMKICNKCNQKKHIDCFSRHSPKREQKRNYCKQCAVLTTKKYEQNHPDRELNYRLNKKYLISKQQYDHILNNQNGKCAICNREFSDAKNRRLCIDHNHLTSKIRGLLCFNCNTALGKVSDDINILKNMIKYLETTL